MESRTSYQFPGLTDGCTAKDETASIPLKGVKYSDIKSDDEDSAKLLYIAWAILLFVYDEGEATEFELIRNRKRSTLRTAINPDKPWQDIRFQYQDSEETGEITSGVCIFTERDVEIPAVSNNVWEKLKSKLIFLGTAISVGNTMLGRIYSVSGVSLAYCFRYTCA